MTSSFGFLTDFTNYLNILNLELQEKKQNRTTELVSSINSFKLKLKLLKTNVCKRFKKF